MRFLKNRTSLALIFIIAIAFVLRLFFLEKLYVFTPDEEYILYITQTLAKDFHIIWIGVSALGFDFYMGPGLEYFLTPFLWLSKGDPIVWGIITCLFGVCSTYLVFWLGNKIFNKKTGLIAAFIYAASALIVYYDQQPYPTGVPLLSLGILISIYLTRYSKKWLILFSFLYGIVFHIHLSLVLVFLVALYWVYQDKKKPSLKIIIVSVLVFLATISPLIVFDYLHNFSNITAPVRVFQAIGKNNRQISIVDRLISPLKPLSRIVYLENGKSNTDEILYPCNFLPGNNSTKINIPVLVCLVIIIGLVFISKDFKKNKDYKLLVVYSLAFLIPYVFLPSIGSVEYYLLGFFPVLILFLANGISKLNIKIICILLGLFFVYNLSVIVSANGDYGLLTKKKMISRVMNTIGSSAFELRETGGPCQGFAGWGYLFSVYGKEPDKNTANQQFSWLVPIGEASQTKYLVLINESRNPIQVSDYKFKIIEGGFTAYIFEN